MPLVWPSRALTSSPSTSANLSSQGVTSCGAQLPEVSDPFRGSALRCVRRPLGQEAQERQGETATELAFAPRWARCWVGT